MRLRVALRHGLLYAALAVGCRAGYDQVLGIGQGKGQAGGSGQLSGGASGDSGTADSGGAGDVVGVGGAGTSPGGGSGGTPSLGGSGGVVTGGSTSAGGASSRGGSGGTGASSASGGSGASATGGTAGDVLGGAAGDQGLAGDTGSGGTGGSGGTMGTGGSGGTGAGGFAGASSLGDCQSESYGGHSYVFCNVKLPWAEARDNCASIGMQLARVDDASENAFLATSFYSSMPLQGMWLSANDSVVEGEWRWLNGDLFWLGDQNGAAQNGLYDGWYVGTQPSATQSTRDCALFDLGGSYGWYDANCTIASVYVCESL